MNTRENTHDMPALLTKSHARAYTRGHRALTTQTTVSTTYSPGRRLTLAALDEWTNWYRRLCQDAQRATFR